MSGSDLQQTARALVPEGKGILAADESFPTIKKRFDSIGIESTEENRRDYRSMLFTTPGAADYISGVILFDETLRQTGADGTRLAEVLQNSGVIPGIKVDKGAKPLAGQPDEKVTEGLDGLHHRQCPRAGALCRPVAGGRPGADRRARGADGRRPRRRPLRGGD